MDVDESQVYASKDQSYENNRSIDFDLIDSKRPAVHPTSKDEFVSLWQILEMRRMCHLEIYPASVRTEATKALYSVITLV